MAAGRERAVTQRDRESIAIRGASAFPLSAADGGAALADENRRPFLRRLVYHRDGAGGSVVEYDEKILVTMANKLYSEARWLVLRYAFIGAILAALVVGIAATFQGLEPTNAGCILTAAAGMGALAGAVYANERAFMLRLEAQRILVQVQIERNTRRG
jgi:hypothetical protein